MGLFVDIPKPKAWPPLSLKDNDGVQKLIAYGRERDPIGDKVHTAFACLFIASIPVNSVSASIGFVLLLIQWLIRWKITSKTITPILFRPILLSCFLFVLWSSISLLWSSDVVVGLDNLRSMRVFLVPLLLWPIMYRWKQLLSSLLIGVFVLNIFQCIDAAQMAFQLPKISRTSGMFGGHPPTAGLWCAASIIIWLSVFNKFKSWKRLAPILGVLFASMGCVLASGRGNMLGLVAAICIFTLLMICKGKSWRSLGTSVFTPIILAAILWYTPKVGTFLQIRVSKPFKNFAAYVQEDDPRSSTGVRLVYWSSSIRAWESHPIFGLGLGGFSTWISVDGGLSTYKERWPDWSSKWLIGVPHPHSMYMGTLAEGGTCGMLLLLVMLSLVACECFHLRSNSIRGPTLCSILGLWLVSGFFDAFQYQSQTLSMFGLIVVMCLYFKTQASSTQCAF